MDLSSNSNAQVLHENTLLKEERGRIKMHLQQLTRKTQDLEEMLLTTTQELQRERDNSRSIVLTLTERLMESREMINKLETENMRLKKDCILAVELLQCNRNVDQGRIVTTINKLSEYVGEAVHDVTQKTQLNTVNKIPEISSNNSETKHSKWKYNMALLQHGVPCDYENKTSHMMSNKEQGTKKDAMQQRYSKIDHNVHEKAEEKLNDTKVTTKTNKKGMQGIRREETPLIDDDNLSKDDEQMKNIDNINVKDEEYSSEVLESPQSTTHLKSALLNEQTIDENKSFSKIQNKQDLQPCFESGSVFDEDDEEGRNTENEGLLGKECSTLVDNVKSGIDEHDKDASLDQHGQDGGLDQHGQDGGLDQHGQDGGLDQHGQDGSLEQHGKDSGFDQHGQDGRLDQHSEEVSFDQHSEYGGLRQHSKDGGLYQRGIDSSLAQHGEDGTLNQHDKDGSLNDFGKDGTLDQHGEDGRLDQYSKDGTLENHGKDGTLDNHGKEGTLDNYDEDGRLDQYGKDGSFDSEVETEELLEERRTEDGPDLLVDNVSPSDIKPTIKENSAKDIEDDSEDTPLV